MILSQPFSGNWPKGAPQAAPALLTKMSNFDSFLESTLTKASMFSTLDKSAGNAIHLPWPKAFISSATCSHASVVRDDI